MQYRIGVQNGGHDNVPVHWGWSMPLSLSGVLTHMHYLTNASSYREEHGMPNAIRVVSSGD